MSADFRDAAIKFDLDQLRQLIEVSSPFVAARIDKLDTEIAKTADQDLAESFCEFARLPGTKAHSFLPRVISNPDFGSVLLGVRLRTESQPYTSFLELIAQTETIDDGNLKALIAVAKTQFAEVNPKFIRIATSADAPLRSYVASLDRVMYGAPLRLTEMRTTGDIKIRLATESRERAALDFYERTLELAPAASRYAALPDIESLRACQQDALLWEIMKGGVTVGFIALTERAFLSAEDVWIADAIVDPSHACQGIYTSAVSLLSAALLPSRPDAWLLGSIHPDNAASVRAAIKLGRRAIRNVYELPMKAVA